MVAAQQSGGMQVVQKQPFQVDTTSTADAKDTRSAQTAARATNGMVTVAATAGTVRQVGVKAVCDPLTYMVLLIALAFFGN
jgi:hypothetical protein